MQRLQWYSGTVVVYDKVYMPHEVYVAVSSRQRNWSVCTPLRLPFSPASGLFAVRRLQPFLAHRAPFSTQRASSISSVMSELV